MKCEICHERDAETAISVSRKGVEDELYVCKECARKERVNRQNRSQRTRRISGLPPGMSMSITEVSGGDDASDEEKDAMFDSVVSAMNGLAEIISAGADAMTNSEPSESVNFRVLPLSRVDAKLRIGSRLHLEGLFMINEIDAVKRAMHALDYELAGVTADGIRDAGHVYELRYTGSAARARDVLASLLEQERNARIRLLKDLPRIIGDAICRALAILKNCRLLSPGELYDLLSPLRLASLEGLLDGISYEEISKLAASVDLSSGEERMDVEERDSVDAGRADDMNGRFEDVVLSESGEELLR